MVINFAIISKQNKVDGRKAIILNCSRSFLPLVLIELASLCVVFVLLRIFQCFSSISGGLRIFDVLPAGTAVDAPRSICFECFFFSSTFTWS